MDIDPRIVSLLVRHEELQVQGTVATPEELCRDCLHLLEPFLQHLGMLQAVADVLGSRASITTATFAETRTPPTLSLQSDTLSPALHGEAASASAKLPGYELLGELGRGGMGVVYKARQIKANRIVALKMILGGGHADAPELARFRTEAEAIARLQHPNIVQVFEVGEWRAGGPGSVPLPFFSLEYCSGGSLAKKLDGTPLPASEAAHIVEQLARAMHAAHAQQVIHRDLKPANVLLAACSLAESTALFPRPSSLVPKITDFGLAKKLDDAGQTQSGAVMGTPSYMAPEQASGRVQEIGPAADVYALGAALPRCQNGRFFEVSSRFR